MDRLKRERFRAIFDYLRQGAPAPVLNLLEVVQVRCVLRYFFGVFGALWALDAAGNDVA